MRSRYRTLGLVGQGQFGRVYCAVHRQTGQLVALKYLGQHFPTHKFLREFRFLLSLQHPNIVTCQASEHSTHQRCLVMDYCEGSTLRNLMEQGDRLTSAHIVNLLSDILSGLAHAHCRDIIHCDIKPENILLTIQPGRWVARISDFGIARLNQELEYAVPGHTGSPAYMAPERFYGCYSAASDLYAVGVLLFELLIGHRPFSGTPAELMSAHLNQLPAIPSTLPQEWRSILCTALQKLPARRFRSATAMLDAILTAGRLGEWAFTGSPACSTNLPSPQVCNLATKRIICSSQSMWFDRPIHALSIWQQDCLVVTDRFVYCLPLLAKTESMVHTVVPLEPDMMVGVAPNGQWVALLRADSPKLMIRWLGKVSQRSDRVIHLSAKSQIQQLLALDIRHLAIVSANPFFCRDFHCNPTTSSATHLAILTRRGNHLGTFTIPLNLKQIVVTSIPYRLLAIDVDEPEIVYVIDLKPYQIRRVAIGIMADFVVTTPGGLIAATQTGQILVLDEWGKRTGLIDASLTAIALCPSKQLLVATWDGKQAALRRIDLQQQNLDLIS